MDNVCSACLPALCLDNAKKSRPKTPFLKVSGGVYILKTIFFTIYKRASVSFCANARKSRPNYQKASIFSKRKGQAGRLLSPMDNVCSTCLPALCSDNAKKSRPKTPFLKVSGGVYILKTIFFTIYKRASVSFCANARQIETKNSVFEGGEGVDI